MDYISKFAIGKQPCDNYTPSDDIFTGSGNEHECIYCKSQPGTVSFCENCRRDHHANGLESCCHEGCSCPKKAAQ